MSAEQWTFIGLLLSTIALNAPTWFLLRKNAGAVQADTELKTAEAAIKIQEGTMLLAREYEKQLKECRKELQDCLQGVSHV